MIPHASFCFARTVYPEKDDFNSPPNSVKQTRLVIWCLESLLILVFPAIVLEPGGMPN